MFFLCINSSVKSVFYIAYQNFTHKKRNLSLSKVASDFIYEMRKNPTNSLWRIVLFFVIFKFLFVDFWMKVEGFETNVLKICYIIRLLNNTFVKLHNAENHTCLHNGENGVSVKNAFVLNAEMLEYQVNVYWTALQLFHRICILCFVGMQNRQILWFRIIWWTLKNKRLYFSCIWIKMVHWFSIYYFL